MHQDSYIGILDTEVVVQDNIDIPVVKGDFAKLPLKARQFIAESVSVSMTAR